MSWSYKITFVFLAFVALIVSLVIRCYGHKTELEYSNYYERELKFQEQIDAQNNAKALVDPIRYEVEGKRVLVIFPEELLDGLSGKVHFLMPSDASKDVAFDFNPLQGVQTFGPLAKGTYKMSIQAKKNGKAYFEEGVIQISR